MPAVSVSRLVAASVQAADRQGAAVKALKDTEGDMAYTQGAYTMTMTDPASKKTVNDKGGYVTIYKKQADGSWKAVADIASSSNPPAAK
ncbi:MAG TPA: hypothetical protein VMG35_24850 [Bryobacteraceae bacterium]|nr:hypothetical protein [Bryobacteraceae bacterium]